MKQPTTKVLAAQIDRLPLNQYTSLAVKAHRDQSIEPIPLPAEYINALPRTIEESALLTLAWMAAYPKSFAEGALFTGSSRKLIVWELCSRPHYPVANLYGTGNVRIMEYFGLTSTGHILIGTRNSVLDDIAWYHPINDRFIDSALRDFIMQALEDKRKKIADLLTQATPLTP